MLHRGTSAPSFVDYDIASPGALDATPSAVSRPPPVLTSADGASPRSGGRRLSRERCQPSRSLSPGDRRSRSPRALVAAAYGGKSKELEFDGAFRVSSPTGGRSSPARSPSGGRRDAPAGAWHGLLAFAKTEAFGERHSAGLDDSVPEAIDNFLAVPAKFERFVAFGVLACLDTFLYTVTFLPLRAGIAAGWLALEAWRRATSRGAAAPPSYAITAFDGFSRARAYDLARFLTILLVNYVLKQVPLSRAYHWIRGQNTIKLYVIVGIMEVFDRLLCAFSQDALDSFYLTTRHATEWRRVLLFFGLVNVVVVSHSLLLYTHLTTLNVVVNASEDSALVALLVSNNFSEIKSAVFKKYNATNLFDIACSDVCERFKLLLFLCLLTLLSWSQVAGDAEERSSGLRVVAAQSAVVFGFEVVADWLKHAFVAKFNRLDASVFDAYAARLARDVVTGRSQGGLALDHTHAVTRRLGFAVLPLACVSLRYLSLASNWLRLSLDLGTAELAVILGGFGVLLFQLKLLSSICLAGLACGYGDAAAQPAAPRPNRARPSNSFDAEGLPGSPKPRPGTPPAAPPRGADAATRAPRPKPPRVDAAPRKATFAEPPAPAKGKGKRGKRR